MMLVRRGTPRRGLISRWQRRNSENAIYEDILREFANHWDIDFAYETNREFDHYLEGKKRPQTSQNQPSESA